MSVLLGEGETDGLPAVGRGGGRGASGQQVRRWNSAALQRVNVSWPSWKDPGVAWPFDRGARASESRRQLEVAGQSQCWAQGPRQPSPALLLVAAASPGSRWHPHPAQSSVPTAPCRAPGRAPLRPLTHPPLPVKASSCPPGPEPSILAISRSKVQAWPELS